MKYAVTVAFALVFALTSPVCLALAALLWLAGAVVDPSRHAVHWLICHWCFQYFRVNPFWSIQVEGREHIPQGPCVLVANHQSMADVVAAFGIYRRFKFVSKASLFALPIVGWAMRLARYVRVERGRPHSTQKMLDDCRSWLRRGTAVLIFPEGTYGTPGALLPFKRGAFRLAIDERVPIVPVVIEGTRSLVIEDGPWLEPRCRIRIRIQPALNPQDFGNEDAVLAERVRAAFRAQLGLTSASGALTPTAASL